MPEESKTAAPEAPVQTETAADLEARLAAMREQEAEAKAEQASKPVLDQVAAADGESFIGKLRQVATDLREAGQLGEEQVLASGEEGSVTATLIKLVGEIVDHIK